MDYVFGGNCMVALALLSLIPSAAHSQKLTSPDIPQPADADVVGPIFQWTVPRPTEAPDRGYPKLPGVEIIPLTQGKFGLMNHHPLLQRIDNNFYVMHTHHTGRHESYSGRSVGGWVSDSAGKTWIGPLELFPPMSKVEDVIALEGQRLLFGSLFHKAKDGKVYALARVGYKSWPNGFGRNLSAMHHHTGFVARTINSKGELGPIFWSELVEDVSADPYMRDFADLSNTKLGKELRDAGPWDNIVGGSLEPNGIRIPIPHRRHASANLNSPGIAEFETSYLSGTHFPASKNVPLAVCLARRIPNNCGDPYHWVAYSRDRGESWSAFKRTEIPTAYNGSAIGQFPDGRVYVVGSLAPSGQGERQPLAIALSTDGIHFNKVYRLLDERIHKIRNDIQHDGFIWLATSYGGSGRKEVAVIKIPIQSLD